MPHKRNPIICERIVGMARLLRGNAIAAMENVALWHERDISHSSVERVILPDSTIILDYMVDKMTNLIDHMKVYPENMLRNLHLTRGLIHSEAILLALTKKGLTREQAYAVVQQNAHRIWNTGEQFKDAILQDEQVKKYLSVEEIEACFDLKKNLRHVDYIFKRVGLI